MHVSTTLETYHIYTDGGCLPNRRGTWAYIILKEDQIAQEKVGSARGTTSVRMEFKAAIEALKAIPENSTSVIFTDSRILIEVVRFKMKQWKLNGWLRSRGQAVIDLDLVTELDTLLATRAVDWRWVRAHSGNRYNDYCDQLCRHEYLTAPCS